MSHNVSRAGGRFSRSPRRGRPGLKKILSYVLIALLAAFFAGSIGVIGLFAWVAKDLPDPDKVNDRNVPQTTRIYDRTGTHVLYEVHGAEKRTVVGLDQVSTHVKNATVAIEDKDFYKHKGFDVRGIIRAFATNLLRGGRSQGGSTITQQFIKNSILSREKTYTRKIKEVILAFEIERRFTKDQILKLYLNEIPYGSLAHGIESASQTFFAKPAKDLSLSESALLAALPQAPSRYSPYGNRTDELVARSHRILDAMAAQGYIAAEEAEEAKKDDVLARVQPRRETIEAPHFVFYVKDLLAEEFGDQAVENGGLKVVTTLDFEKQKMAEEIISEHMDDGLAKKWDANTAAMMAVDPATGDILAMVGSADYFDESINGKFNALQGKLQPGSSIKPVVYAAAFEKGYTPDTVVNDVVTVFRNYPEDYTPKNYDLLERGPVTLKEALAGSLNIPAVQVLYLTGIDRFLDFASRLGYTTFVKSRVGLSLTLGGGEVRPLEHINAYSAFAQEGVIRPATAVLRVEDRDGKVILDNESDRPPAKRVFDKEIARQINAILSDNAARAYIFGEQNYLTLAGRPAAAKTGTTNDYNDAWAIGYTPSLVAGVWVGNADGKEMKKGADGSKVAAPIWKAFMDRALAGEPAEEFNAPQPVVTGKPVLDGDKSARVKVKVDTISGKLATALTPPELVEERAFGVPHSILFFVDKDDPRGPQPEDPSKDPQFANWESAVAEWAKAQNIVAADPPTEFDDVHVPENAPSASFARPTEGETVPSRTMAVDVNASARRGVARIEYFIDGEFVDMRTSWPFGGALTVPNRFIKGFHTLSAKVYDDVSNMAETSVAFNLTAEPGPLDVQWSAPWNFQTISRSSGFPFSIRFRIDDIKSIRQIRLSDRSVADDTVTYVGEVQDPVLPNMAMEWQAPAALGRHILILQATLVGGDVRTQEIAVDVTQ